MDEMLMEMQECLQEIYHKSGKALKKIEQKMGQRNRSHYGNRNGNMGYRDDFDQFDNGDMGERNNYFRMGGSGYDPQYM